MRSQVRNERSITHSTALVVSFGITIFRVLMAVVASALLVISTERAFAVSMIIFGIMILDYYDGVIFKWASLDQIKHLRIKRRIWDSVTDRVTILGGSTVLAIVDSSFLIAWAVIVLRELIVSGYVSNQYRKGFMIYPRRMAKLACVAVGLIPIAHLLVSNIGGMLMALVAAILTVPALQEYRVRRNQHRVNSPSRVDDDLMEIF